MEMEIVNEVLKTLWFLSLFGVANMAPVFFQRIPFLKIPVDFGRSLKKKRIFGDNKTWRGLISAPLLSLLYFLLQQYLYSNFDFLKEISSFDYQKMSLWFPLMVGLGVILGDLVKSFFKRRKNIAPGKSWMPFDQIDYLLGGLFLSYFFFAPSFFMFFMVLGMGFVLHILFNFFGHWLKLTNKPI